MNQLSLEFKVGAFTLVGLFATGYLFYSLRPDAFDRKKVVTYYTLLDTAGGIVTKSHVKTNGVSIGKVKAVDLGTNNTKITLEVQADVPVPKGSTLQIKSVGLLGDSHVEIRRAADSGEFLKDGDLIPQSKDGTDLSGLIDIAGSIAADIKKVTANLANVLGTEDGRKKVGSIVDNIEGFAKNLNDILTENRSDFRDAIVNVKTVSANLASILDEENKQKIDRIIASFDEAMVEVRSASRNINLISERVERGEGTLGRLVNDDTAMTELEGAIKDIRKVLSPATRVQIGIDSHIEARTDNSAQTYFNLILKTRPDRYYLLGFTDTQDEITEERTINIDETCDDKKKDCETATRTSRRTEKALKFNVQFAKRWGPLGLRFGFFESTGGIGSDFYLFRDRLRFTAEAWNWRTKENDIRRVAHIKAYASILFYDHIYFMAGIDDPLKFENRGEADKLQPTNYFAGLGLSFNDEDLKALFGAAALTSAL